ncbi:MAG: hypothetical protein ACE5D7_10220, partial [Fidelibacterota bacterium]
MGIKFLFLSKTTYYKRELTPYIFYRTFIILFLFIAVIYVFHCSNSNDSDKEFHPSDKEFHPSYMEWECRVCEGFQTGDPDYEVAGLTWFKEFLYAGVRAHRYTDPNGGYYDCFKIYRSKDSKNWETVVGDDKRIPCGFGSKANWVFQQFQIFNDYLYCAVGIVLWRSYDGVNWEPIAGKNGIFPRGFGVYDVWDLECMAVYKNHLYVALARSVGGQIWRSPDGLNWEQVVGDDAETPDGFDDKKHNLFPSRMMVFKDQLFIVSTDGGVYIFRTYNGIQWEQTIIPETLEKQYFVDSIEIFKDRLVLGIGSGKGVLVYSSDDGVNWKQVNEAGFGSGANIGIYSLKTFNDWLFAGTENGNFGCEIWATNDLSSWINVIRYGFYPTYQLGRNGSCTSMIVVNDALFVGTYAAG